VDDLAKHLDLKPIVISSRRKSKSQKLIRNFLARLKKLAETCEFGGYREEAIQDRFVCCFREGTIQCKLLVVADLT